MPNYCDFEMKIKGKKKDVIELVAWLNADYYYKMFKDDDKEEFCSEKHHFYRVFEFNPSKEECLNDLKEDLDDDIVSVSGCGYCAWSVHSCMLSGAGAYFGNRDYEFATTLDRASKDLNLEIEVFSYEPGCAFIEMYHIDKGEILRDDCLNFEELDVEVTLDDLGITEEELNEEYEGDITEVEEYYSIFEDKIRDRYFEFTI